MRPFSSTISLDEARRRLQDNVRPMDRVQRVPLDQAAGRVAATDVTSSIDVPPFTRAAMDGYAVVAADTASAGAERPVELELIDRVFTGEVGRQTVGRGGCVEIATGAPLPRVPTPSSWWKKRGDPETRSVFWAPSPLDRTSASAAPTSSPGSPS